jgi:hypothetical protein
MKATNQIIKLLDERAVLQFGGYVKRANSASLKGEISEIAGLIAHIRREIEDISYPEDKVKNAWDDYVKKLDSIKRNSRYFYRHCIDKELQRAYYENGPREHPQDSGGNGNADWDYSQYLHRVEILENYYGLRDKLQRELEAAQDRARDFIALIDAKINKLMPKAIKEAQAMGIEAGGLEPVALCRAMIKAQPKPEDKPEITLEPCDWIDGRPIFRGADIKRVFEEKEHVWFQGGRVLSRKLYRRFTQALGFAPDVHYTEDGLIIEHDKFKARITADSMKNIDMYNALVVNTERKEAPSRRALRTLEAMGIAA